VIINIVRDPLDTLLSNYRVNFQDDSMLSSHDISSLVNAYVVYLKIIAHFRKVLPGRVIDITYENLTSRTATVMRQLLMKIGLDWSESVLKHSKQHRVVNTASQGQVRRDVYSTSIGGWRRYKIQLNPLIQLLEKHLSELRLSDSLPYVSEMNWNLDHNFVYNDNLRDEL
jgi:hypothetical protein